MSMRYYNHFVKDIKELYFSYQCKQVNQDFSVLVSEMCAYRSDVKACRKQWKCIFMSLIDFFSIGNAWLIMLDKTIVQEFITADVWCKENKLITPSLTSSRPRSYILPTFYFSSQLLAFLFLRKFGNMRINFLWESWITSQNLLYYLYHSYYHCQATATLLPCRYN